MGTDIEGGNRFAYELSLDELHGLLMLPYDTGNLFGIAFLVWTYEG